RLIGAIMITNTILNFFRFLFLKIDRSSLHIKTLSLSFDFALLAQPVKDSPYVTVLKSCLLFQGGSINAFPGPFDNG
ncbi:MAG: hypothetical protein JSW15_07455, partial [Deltaproteobacteria bacterium]